MVRERLGIPILGSRVEVRTSDVRNKLKFWFRKLAA